MTHCTHRLFIVAKISTVGAIEQRGKHSGPRVDNHARGDTHVQIRQHGHVKKKRFLTNGVRTRLFVQIRRRPRAADVARKKFPLPSIHTDQTRSVASQTETEIENVFPYTRRRRTAGSTFLSLASAATSNTPKSNHPHRTHRTHRTH
jgi:hypothetical protein